MNIRPVGLLVVCLLYSLCFFVAPSAHAADECAQYTAEQMFEPKHNIYTDTEEVKLGKYILREEYPNTRRWFGRIYRKEIALLRAIEATLQPHLPKYAQRFPTTYRILPDDTRFDAHTLPGGIILVTSGVFFLGEINDIAVLQAHELGHKAFRHGTHRSTVELESKRLLFATLLAHNDLLYREDAAEQLELLIGPAPNLQELAIEQEHESEIFSAHVATSAGYSVQGMAQMHEDEYDAAREERLRAFMDHPSRIDRARILRCFADKPVVERPQLEAMLAEIKALYMKKYTR